MFTFTTSDVFEETSSDLFPYPIKKGQELVLTKGSNDPVCDSFPLFAEEGDAPIVGKLPSGEWIQWTPTILFEDNGPSINDPPEDMASNVLSDGGGEIATQAGEKMKCSNVQRSFVNEDTCFLSTESTACSASQLAGEVLFPLVVCGSIGEVANDPALPEHFDVRGEAENQDSEFYNNQKQVVWTEVALYGNDQLRQRMAWALAQILTTVPLNIDGEGLTKIYTNYYDIFVTHAFGNYRDILAE